MKKNAITLLLAALSLTFIGCGNSNTQNNETETNAIKIAAPMGNEIYFSVYPHFPHAEPPCQDNDALLCNEENVTEEAIEAFSTLVAKKPAIVPFDNNWYDGDIKFPKEAVMALHKKGIVPQIRVLPRSSSQENLYEKKYTLARIIAKDFDTQLKQWAIDSKNTKDSEGNPIPIMFDFALEMNGDWFAWSRYKEDANDMNHTYRKRHGAKEYKAAYIHIIELFRKLDVAHITWVFHANLTSDPNETWNKPANYYPGDKYIDWVGVSLYGTYTPYTWETFSELFKEHREEWMFTKKPFAIFEFAAMEKEDSCYYKNKKNCDPDKNITHSAQSKRAWLENAFKTIRNSHEGNLTIKAINYWSESWYDDTDEKYPYLVSFEVNSSVDALESFNTLINDDQFSSEVIIGH